METAYPPITPRRRSRRGSAYVALAALPALFVLVVIGVTGYFRLGSDTAALRETLMDSSPGQWQKRIAIHIGWVTTRLVRWGAQWAKLDPEPSAALQALDAAEVGVYHLRPGSAPLSLGAALVRADKVMTRRGWDRVVGVCERQQLVAVYLPRRGLSTRRVKCCVLVVSGRDLVVASVRGKVEPLLALAQKRLGNEPGPAPLRDLGWPFAEKSLQPGFSGLANFARESRF